jgi:hypothetical protein
VVGQDGTRHDFTPHLGVGVVTLNPTGADPLEVITDAERQALGPASGTPWAQDATVPTNPGGLIDIRID